MGAGQNDRHRRADGDCTIRRGQRIQACFVLNRVHDEDRDGDKDVPQYLVLMTEPKDGLPFDFNSFRVFTWNLRRHRYETAYRERNIMGFLPVSVGSQNFDKEGTQPIFTLKLQNEDGQTTAHTYRLAGPLVRRVLAPGEEAQKLAQIHKEPKKKRPRPPITTTMRARPDSRKV